jgi:hypothetical protein
MSINSRQWPLFLSGAFISLECRRGTHRRSRSFASKGRSTCQTRKSGIGQRRPYCRPKNKPRPVHAAGASTGCCLNLWALVIRAVSGGRGLRPGLGHWFYTYITPLRAPCDRHHTSSGLRPRFAPLMAAPPQPSPPMRSFLIVRAQMQFALIAATQALRLS